MPGGGKKPKLPEWDHFIPLTDEAGNKRVKCKLCNWTCSPKFTRMSQHHKSHMEKLIRCGAPGGKSAVDLTVSLQPSLRKPNTRHVRANLDIASVVNTYFRHPLHQPTSYARRGACERSAHTMPQAPPRLSRSGVFPGDRGTGLE